MKNTGLGVRFIGLSSNYFHLPRRAGHYINHIIGVPIEKVNASERLTEHFSKLHGFPSTFFYVCHSL